MAPESPSRPPAPARLCDGSTASSAAVDGVHFPSLLAHLIKLGQDEAAANAADAAAAAKAASKPTSLLPPGLSSGSAAAAASPSEKNAMFARDSASVREWMRHAVEARLADPVVVSSAAILAVRFLQRRYRYPSLSCAAQSSLGAGSTVRRRWGFGNRRRRTPSAGVVSELLAVTCLHLASKYHCVEPLDAGALGSLRSMSKVFSLGYEISLSMGAALNASFRANACSLQSLFCELADEPAVVRACSEWFALCLVLLLDPSREEEGALPLSSPSRHGGRRLFSAPSSATTTPFTPARNAASPAAATPSSTRTPPATSASSSSGVLLHHDVFSRATVLGLGSLVLARRLARARGPCLPTQVKETLGLRDSDALELVAEGVCLARKAFETETPPPDAEEDGEESSIGGGGGNQGKGILAGVAVFENDVVASSGDPARTLLEWVTDSSEYKYGAAAPASSDGLGKAAGAARDGQGPPEFARGTPLSCVAAGGGASGSPPSGGRSPARSQSQARSRDGFGSSSAGSRTCSVTSECRSRAGGRVSSPGCGGSATEHQARPGSSSTPCLNLHTAEGPTRSPGSGSSAPTPSPDCESDASCDEPPTRKRVAPDQERGGDRPSRDGGRAGNKRPRREVGGDTSSSARALPRRKAGTSAAAAAALAPGSPEQEKSDRWEVLIDRVLAALDDHCGCSFCGLRDGSGERGAPIACERSSAQATTPMAPSPPRPLYNPPREPPNDDVDGKHAAASAASAARGRLPPYPPFTPPGPLPPPPPAAPLRVSPSLHGLSRGSDGGRGAAAEIEPMDTERPTVGQAGGGRGAKRPGVAAGGAGYGGPLLKLCTAAMASLAGSSKGASSSGDASGEEEGSQSWWW